MVWVVRNEVHDRGTPGVVDKGGAMLLIDTVDGCVIERAAGEMVS
jgi:hypothetical protein